MRTAPPKKLVRPLHEHVGESLRSVLRFDDDGAKLLYVRNNIEAQYSQTDIENILQDSRLEAFEKTHQESLYTHGALNCTIRCFEDAVEILAVDDERHGNVIALDRKVLGEQADVLETCLEIIDTDGKTAL